MQTDQGGIARVGRLAVRVLAEMSASRRLLGDISTLRDADPAVDLPHPNRAYATSKWRFSLAVSLARLTHSHFIYGFLGLAKSHALLPVMRRPFLVFVHGIEAWPGPLARQDRIDVSKKASRIVAISHHTKQMACQLDPTYERTTVCWLATEDDVLPSPRGELAPPRVLIVGRIAEGYKGHRELIECWPRIVSAVPHAILTIAGKGPLYDEYRALAAQSPVAGQIEFLGFVPESEMPALWQRTAIFAMPSRGEGFGLVYIEAMRYGVPVIASIHDAGREVNADGETGFNIDMDRPEELPERIIELLTNRNRATEMGLAGQRRWEQHFRFSAFRERFVPIINDFLTA